MLLKRFFLPGLALICTRAIAQDMPDMWTKGASSQKEHPHLQLLHIKPITAADKELFWLRKVILQPVR